MMKDRTGTRKKYDVETLRMDFPALQQEVHGHPLVYLDNAASTQKPYAVIDRLVNYYSREHANVHRGVHHLSQIATDAFEESRKKMQCFVGAEHDREIIFTRGTTESINLVASSFGRAYLNEGDEVLISGLEHHSNIVPWQLICEQRGAKLRVIPLLDSGELDLETLDELLTPRTRILSIACISNALGTINPVREIIRKAHEREIPVMLDAAQAAPHQRIDVQELDCDFLALSGHKMYGPTGIGILYGKEKWLEAMPPYHGGGEMIEQVTFEKSTYAGLPFKFEAGTPNIADSIGLGAAVDYLEAIGMDAIAAHEQELLSYALGELEQIEGLRFIGQARHRAGVISFLVGDIHPFDIGTILDQLGVAVRTGHHCTQPIMDRFGIPGTVRASIGLYSTRADIDRLVEAILRAKKMFER